jgi:hypothetical protein
MYSTCKKGPSLAQHHKHNLLLVKIVVQFNGNSCIAHNLFYCIGIVNLVLDPFAEML